MRVELFLVAAASLLLVGCGQNTGVAAEAAPVDAPAPVAPVAAPPAPAVTQVAESDDAKAIDAQSELNRRTCLAGHGTWDATYSVPTQVEGHPMVGMCSGQSDRPVCADHDEACWAYVAGTNPSYEGRLHPNGA